MTTLDSPDRIRQMLHHMGDLTTRLVREAELAGRASAQEQIARESGDDALASVLAVDVQEHAAQVEKMQQRLHLSRQGINARVNDAS